MPARLALAALLMALVAAAAHACTIGVAEGRATPDGRPLLWKVRDNGAYPDNEVYWNDALSVPFLAVVTADGAPDSPAWMGVNVHGFAVVNSNVNALEDTTTTRANGELMRAALGSCRSVAEFLDLLTATDGIRDTHGDFGVIDSTGTAMIIEASRHDFWVYDTRDTERGFIVRTNFAAVDTAENGGIAGLPGAERFVRATDLVTGWVDAGELTAGKLTGRLARDFSRWNSQPTAVPCYDCGEPDSLHGCFDTWFSISGGGTVSAAVIQGVAPPPAGEPGWLSTMWVMLGQPACTVAAPYWPVGPAPAMADGVGTAPLCDAANHIRLFEVFDIDWHRNLVETFALRDGAGGGLWSLTLPWEEAALEAAEDRLRQWREEPPAAAVVLAFEDSLAQSAHELLGLDVITRAPARPPATAALGLAAAPNPFNPVTTLSFELPGSVHVRLDVHDLRGRRVARLIDEERPAGRHRATWRADDAPSGVYLARLAAAGVTEHVELVLVR